MLGEGKLNVYLCEMDEQANEMLSAIIAELDKRLGINENLKETDQMRRVQMMNSIKAQAEEIVLKEFVYVYEPFPIHV